MFIVIKKTRCGDVESSWFAEDVARIDHAKVFLGIAAFESWVCVNRAEGEAG